MRNNYYYYALILFGYLFFTTSYAEQPNQCAVEKIKKTNKIIADAICDPVAGDLYIKHDHKKNVIWFESKNKKLYYRLIKLEHNADPSLVGEEKSIAFITPQIIHLENKQYVGLTISERSMRGNGLGQCGAGSEIYFISLEIFKAKIIERNRFLVYSCNKDIYLEDDGSGEDDAIKVNADNEIIFKWLDYPDYENSVTGKYNFISNELSLTENKK